MTDLQKNIEFLVKQIITLCNPEKIFLFGSNARGDASQHSDIDFLIVMPEGTHKRNTAKMLYTRIDSNGLSFDLLVTTPSCLEKHKDNIGLIYKTILEEGKLLYAA